jgi:hypothetical protein
MGSKLARSVRSHTLKGANLADHARQTTQNLERCQPAQKRDRRSWGEMCGRMAQADLYRGFVSWSIVTEVVMCVLRNEGVSGYLIGWS